MSEHWLKIAPEYFDDILIGKKTFEVRKDDRMPAYAVDDILHLQEYSNCEYTRREIVVNILYVLRDNRFCKDGFCIIGFMPPYPIINVLLPDGRRLISSSKDDPDYPGITIDLISADGEADSMVWAEYNTERDGYADNEKLRLLIWDAVKDEPTVNMSYDTSTFESDD